MRFISNILKFLIFIVFVVPIFLNFFVLVKSCKRAYSNIEDLPSKNVILLLGTSKYFRGRSDNLFFKNRIKAAADVFFEAKASYIIASGDGKNHEASDMKEGLVKLGVPSDLIYTDDKGYSTVESIFRAKNVFKVDDIIIISQKFHNQRALFLADFYGLDAVAYNAKDVQYFGFRVSIRDFFAKLKSFYDIFFYKGVVDKKINIKDKIKNINIAKYRKCDLNLIGEEYEK